MPPGLRTLVNSLGEALCGLWGEGKDSSFFYAELAHSGCEYLSQLWEETSVGPSAKKKGTEYPRLNASRGPLHGAMACVELQSGNGGPFPQQPTCRAASSWTSFPKSCTQYDASSVHHHLFLISVILLQSNILQGKFLTATNECLLRKSTDSY